MSSTLYGDGARSNLRACVAGVDRALSQAPPGPALRTAWDDLVKMLALGPAPETRECPKCHTVGMRTASRCGNCWTALGPLPDGPDEKIAEQPKHGTTTSDQEDS
jgi:hypothetical protein